MPSDNQPDDMPDDGPPPSDVGIVWHHFTAREWGKASVTKTAVGTALRLAEELLTRAYVAINSPEGTAEAGAFIEDMRLLAMARQSSSRATQLRKTVLARARIEFLMAIDLVEEGEQDNLSDVVTHLTARYPQWGSRLSLAHVGRAVEAWSSSVRESRGNPGRRVGGQHKADVVGQDLGRTLCADAKAVIVEIYR